MAHYEQSTASDYRDLLVRLRDFAVGDHVDTVAVAAGGTGYVLGDVLTMAGGTILTVAATVEVTGVSAGVITAVEIRRAGRIRATRRRRTRRRAERARGPASH